MLRYPFATFIVTFAMFSFLGVLIASGEVQLSLSAPQTQQFTIKRVMLACAGDKESRRSPTLLRAAKKQCNAASVCEIDTTALLQQANIEIDYRCTQEITIRYHCSLTIDNIVSSSAFRATLYRGQKAALLCTQGNV